jgi:hypothetical protein
VARKRWHIVRKPALLMMAGLGLIVVGIVSLVLSDEVAKGWWQGTLQALGVGLVIGGLVDVLAISKLNQVIQSTSDRERAKITLSAEAIVAHIPDNDVAWYLDWLRDDKHPIGERAAVLHRLNFRQRSFLLDQLDSKLRDQLVNAGVYGS